MRWLLPSALSAGFVAAVGVFVRGTSYPVLPPSLQLTTTDSPPTLNSECPAGTLPDNLVCVPVPDTSRGTEALDPQRSIHRNSLGVWDSYEQIPRRPDRPADYSMYMFPLSSVRPDDIVSGYDLHAADEYQRRGPNLHAIGHGGVDIIALRGTPVHMMPLLAQQGAATVVYVGVIFGNTVVTRHRVREADRYRDYLALFGHLDRAAPNLTRGQSIGPGELVGLVGDSGSPGVIHLHLELRQVRLGVDPMALESNELTKNSRTVACDPRNLLPLRDAVQPNP